MFKTFAVFLLLGLATAMSQVNTSTLDGLVTDPQGAFVPKVEIVVTNTLTTQTFRTVTDTKGHWAVPSLPTSTYSVTASAPGAKMPAPSSVTPGCDILNRNSPEKRRGVNLSSTGS